VTWNGLALEPPVPQVPLGAMNQTKTFIALNDFDTIWLFNIAMENGPFIDGLPI